MNPKKKRSGGHETNVIIIFKNGCIDIASEPLERVTYNELILKIARSEVMFMTS